MGMPPSAQEAGGHLHDEEGRGEDEDCRDPEHHLSLHLPLKRLPLDLLLKGAFLRGRLLIDRPPQQGWNRRVAPARM